MRDEWIVRVPASSANLGSGFDALAVALGVHLEARLGGEAPAGEGHPAVRAFREAGGHGSFSVRAAFPGGRGLGFSGAARVAGALAALVQQGHEPENAAPAVLRLAAAQEGHADNVAASLLGGVVAVAEGRACRVPLGRVPVVVVWTPEAENSTAGSRRTLPTTVPFADAVHNVGAAALLVAALAAGDLDALAVATRDRLHQAARLERMPETRTAIEAAVAAGAAAAWLSGSGPSAAAFVDPARAEVVAAALPASGRVRVLPIAIGGAEVVPVGDDAIDAGEG
ncbi:MAG: homoserine kinase [Actinomycetota bacterium]